MKHTAVNKPITFWGCALAGEVGESCNLIKKFDRDGLYDEDDNNIIDLLALELADVFIYDVLTARVFDIDLEDAILRKIKILKEKYPNY